LLFVKVVVEVAEVVGDKLFLGDARGGDVTFQTYSA